MFAEDTELYSSTPHSTTDSLFCNIHNCVSDVKKWTIHNKLQLSEREALLFNPSTSSHLPDVQKRSQNDIPFCNTVCSVGVMFDNGLTMKQQVDKICQTAYFEIQWIGSFRQFLTLRPQNTCPVSWTLSCRLL